MVNLWQLFLSHSTPWLYGWKCLFVDQSVHRLIHAEVSQQPLDGSQWEYVQMFMVPWQSSLLVLLREPPCPSTISQSCWCEYRFLVLFNLNRRKKKYWFCWRPGVFSQKKNLMVVPNHLISGVFLGWSGLCWLNWIGACCSFKFKLHLI